jgi:hypothetical protein
MMHSAIALLVGEAMTALMTMPAHDTTKRNVVKGCPGLE